MSLGGYVRHPRLEMYPSLQRIQDSVGAKWILKSIVLISILALWNLDPSNRRI